MQTCRFYKLSFSFLFRTIWLFSSTGSHYSRVSLRKIRFITCKKKNRPILQFPLVNSNYYLPTFKLLSARIYCICCRHKNCQIFIPTRKKYFSKAQTILHYLQTYTVLKQVDLQKYVKGRFAYLQTYKVLKHTAVSMSSASCFAYLQTYKVLKPIQSGISHEEAFAYLQTYKVLKPQTSNNASRFSPNFNILAICSKFVLKFNKTIFWIKNRNSFSS